MPNIQELIDTRVGLVDKARDIMIVADSADREMTAEERKQYDAIFVDVDKMGDQIDKIKADDERRAKLAEYTETPVEERILPEGVDEAPNLSKTATEDYRKAFNTYLLRGERTPESEMRALQMDSDTAGGYTVVPEQFMAELIQAVDNLVVMRQLGRTFGVANAESMGAPSLDNDPADPTWTAEILTGDEDSTMDFGKRNLYPHPAAQRLKVSKKLLRASALSIDAIVRERLAYKMAVVQENGYMNGSGANEPLGIFVASADGISTGRDVSTGNTDTEIRGDGLVDAKYALKSNYWGQARWIFHRDGVKMIRKLKDGEGQYLWKPGLSSDRGDTILDVPVIMSEYAPNTFTTGLYVGIIGDFSRYWIADALNMTIQVLVELYAETNHNGYISRAESDGMPVLEEAFARVTLT